MPENNDSQVSLRKSDAKIIQKFCFFFIKLSGSLAHTYLLCHYKHKHEYLRDNRCDSLECDICWRRDKTI